MKAYVVHIKGFGRDRNGLERVLYATREQVDKLLAMRIDNKTKRVFVEMGAFIFSPDDIAYIERTERDRYSLPQYFLDECSKSEPSLGAGVLEGNKMLANSQPTVSVPPIGKEKYAEARKKINAFIEKHKTE